MKENILDVLMYLFEHYMDGENNVDPVNGDVTFAHFVALDANRTRVAQVQVACSTQCFVANIDTIDAILDSVRFTP